MFNRLKTQTRITHKLLIALIVILFSSIVIAALYFDSSNRFKHNAKQSELIHTVLTKYSDIALYTFEKLVAMGEIARTGELKSPLTRSQNEEKLRQTLFQVRSSLLEKIAISEQFDTSQELLKLDQITQKVERIIITSQEIKMLVQNQQRQQAHQLYQLLEKQGVHGAFNRLISEAVEEEQHQADLIRESTQALSERNNRLLGFALGILSLFTMATIWFFWRRITLATDQLHQATAYYQKGELAHRIATQQDLEFSKLADALNNMAGQLAEQRDQLSGAKASLEEKVAERTKALECSNQKLALVDRQRRQFLADIGHELRTPLTIMRGEAEVLLRNEQAPATQYREVLSTIVDQVSHTTALIEDLMLVARSSAGELKLTQSAFDIAITVSDLFELYRRKASDMAQTLELESVNTLLLNGDERRIKQVIMILLENALGYSAKGSVTQVKVFQRNDVCVMHIIDSGQGITEQEQAQVFERFYRSNRAKVPGSGLGLPVAKAIVDAHGGHISLKANSGNVGATATVLLPLKGEENNENIIS